MTPFDDFAYLINHVLLGEEPTVEDFILLVGTLVAFVAFILWCCFPVQVQPKENITHRQLACRSTQHGQIQHNYSKHNSSGYNYSIKNSHTYHCS